MDPNRFDRLSKSIANRFTRRQMLGGLGAGGLAAAVLADPARGADAVTCVYNFEATIDFGSSSTVPSSSEFAGELTITIEPDGAINNARLVKSDGHTWKVVGQATGRAINLRMSVPQTGAFIAVGTGRGPITDCTTAMGGPASGPVRGDIGSWTATRKAAGPDAPVSTPTVAVPTVAATTVVGTNAVAAPTEDAGGAATPEATTCDLECGADTLGLDSGNCVCLCPAGLTMCRAMPHSPHAKGGVIFQPSVTATATGFCVDAANDVSNCGGCGAVCAPNAGATCVAGVCA